MVVCVQIYVDNNHHICGVQIYVEIERARLTKMLARIKEDEGAVEEAADILQEVAVVSRPLHLCLKAMGTALHGIPPVLGIYLPAVVVGGLYGGQETVSDLGAQKLIHMLIER
jgi:hypothetical protein